MILIAIAVRFMVEGLKEVFPGWSSSLELYFPIYRRQSHWLPHETSGVRLKIGLSSEFLLLSLSTIFVIFGLSNEFPNWDLEIRIVIERPIPSPVIAKIIGVLVSLKNQTW